MTNREKVLRGYTEPFSLVEHNEGLGSRVRRYLVLATMAVLLIVCVITASLMDDLAPTFNGKVDVAALQQDASAYDLQDADGAAYVIVAENLEKTQAQNVCFSVVFNFRGYDTMGESFILIAALAGSLCILRSPKKHKAEKAAEKIEEKTEAGKEEQA